MPNDDYGYKSGSSIACPFVAGAAALIKAKYPHMTPAQIIAKIEASAEPVPTLGGKIKTGGNANADCIVTVTDSTKPITTSIPEVTYTDGEAPA